ncbi:hypothetical protein MK852_21695 [Shewanella benthica]|uniref:hypothetical protein n=1 Tax=Shewanella benthica TaxID=43661 RepID=UPI0018792153|nr:hypothetical protein [Shewanella benthica]MBE7216609.1 hypothetical protein [Shewanella benthica]MCL1064736.1 hypothetical protein [Shewanella benthica]
MQKNNEMYRDHIIIPSASGPKEYVGSYSVWLPETNNSFKAVLQGSLSGQYSTIEDACNAAIVEAKIAIDNIL